MKEFEIIEQTLPVIKINFEEIKENLEVSLDKYKSLIVTKETLKEIKQTQKSLAGLKIKIDDYRKSIKKEMSVPIAEFEMKCKELYKLVEEAEEPLKSGIKIYDDGVRENKRKLAQEHVQKQIQELGLIEKYANQLIILDSYSNLTSNDNATKLDINKRAKELFNRQKQELEIIELIKNTIKKKNEGISQKMKIEDFQDLIDDEEISITDLIGAVETEAELILQAENKIKEEILEEIDTSKLNIGVDSTSITTGLIDSKEYLITLSINTNEIGKILLEEFLNKNKFDYNVKIKRRVL